MPFWKQGDITKYLFNPTIACKLGFVIDPRKWIRDESCAALYIGLGVNLVAYDIINPDLWKLCCVSHNFLCLSGAVKGSGRLKGVNNPDSSEGLDSRNLRIKVSPCPDGGLCCYLWKSISVEWVIRNVGGLF